VWITTAGSLDWPKTANREAQQQSLREMIRALRRSRFNTIYFQVRARGDAYYRSSLEPWAENLTGTIGRDPGWDPLEFALTEAHAAGMEVHAWFNVFKVRSNGKIPNTSPQHPARTFSRSIIMYEGEGWLDPGVPEVRAHLLTVALEIARQYDIDGMHFDFLRYPGREFRDDESYRRYGEGRPRDEWRRSNIDRFVRAFHDSVGLFKPLLKIGSAPVGVFESGNGWGAYASYYQDSRGWLREGWEDYLAPQLYWDIGASAGDPDFAALTRSWQEASAGRQVIAGIAAYKPEVAEQIPEQIDSARAAGMAGQAFFRYEFIADPALLGGRYDRPANIPPMPWKDSTPPRPPAVLAVTETAPGRFSLEWTVPPRAADGELPRYYNVYRWPTPSIPFDDARSLVTVTPDARNSYIDTVTVPEGATYHYAVTAFDRLHNESEPAFASATLQEVAELEERINPATTLTTMISGSSAPLIAYRLVGRTRVSLEIAGESDSIAVPLLPAGPTVQEAGTYVVGFPQERFGPGRYRLRLRAGTTVIDQALVVN